MSTRLPYLFDMETQDPDDFITLILLLSHPKVDLRAVTITPGTPAQVGLVRWTLNRYGRNDIPVGARIYKAPTGDGEATETKVAVSAWHYKHLKGQPNAPTQETVAEADGSGASILRSVMSPHTTLVTGAALHNLGALLRELKEEECTPGCLGRLFVQGGFAGDNVVPPENVLKKFAGMITCPTFNLCGDIPSAKLVLEKRRLFSELRFVSKNVCHGVKYDMPLHCALLDSLSTLPLTPPQQMFVKMSTDTLHHYLERGGKAMHDPLAAMCSLNPDQIGDWTEVELYCEKGAWGSRIAPGSGVRIITGFRWLEFVRTLLDAPNSWVPSKTHSSVQLTEGQNDNKDNDDDEVQPPKQDSKPKKERNRLVGM